MGNGQRNSDPIPEFRRGLGTKVAVTIGHVVMWIAIPTVGAFLLGLFIVLPAYIGLSAYFVWQRGYGFACQSETIAEALSPSSRVGRRIEMRVGMTRRTASGQNEGRHNLRPSRGCE